MAHLTVRWAFAALWLTLAPVSALADPVENPQEYQLKAAFIYNFSQFIEWPGAAFANADSPFPICVMGNDPFGDSLVALQKRSYKGRPIVVSYPRTIAEARLCRILYVDNPRATPLGRDVGKALADAPVLTISSSGDTRDSGIAVGFVQQSGKIRWILNLDAARRAQLNISSKLIEIAIEVVGEARR